MRKHGEKWIQEIDGVNHLLMALCDRKKYHGSSCHGCSFVDAWDDDCTLKVPPCDMGCRIKDLGPVNEDGLLPCPFCGEYPVLDAQENWDNKDVWFLECTGCGARTAEYFEDTEAIYAWNQRGGV